MHLICVHVLFLYITSVYSVSVANIINATYSTGISFSKANLTTANACMCACINHPHCLSISVMKLSTNTYYCQLFATYPIKSSQLSSSLISNVMIYADRTLSSVYINNRSSLSNPTNLFLNNTKPWIPIFKLFSGNNQSFLWLNSSNLTTLTAIPKILINGTTSHWFNILISQWNQGLYKPNQVAIAFIVNRTIILDFLIFNVSQPNITSWFSITGLASNQYWDISTYKSNPVGQTQMTSVFTDTSCVRSFNCNYKASASCSEDFYGLFFVYGGYRDTCIAAVRNMSKVLIPSIYYSPTTTLTNGNLSYYNVADGLMGFVQ